jgi:hypothetical protein
MLAMRVPRLQFRVGLLMAAIVLMALGLAALKDPTQPRVSIALTLTIAALLTAALLARFARTPGDRARWFGFSLFGSTYLVLVATAWRDQLPTTILVEGLAELLTIHYGPYPTPTGRGPWYTNAIHDANGRFALGVLKLIDLYLTLVVAGSGAMLTGALADWLGGERSGTSVESESANRDR